MKLHALRYPALLAVAASILPIVAQAQTTVNTLITRIQVTANSLIGLLFIIATLVFLWGIVKFIASAGDEAKRKSAKGLMTWGILGLAVMAAAWGITQVLIEYFNVPAKGPVFVPYPVP